MDSFIRGTHAPYTKFCSTPDHLLSNHSYILRRAYDIVHQNHSYTQPNTPKCHRKIHHRRNLIPRFIIFYIEPIINFIFFIVTLSLHTYLRFSLSASNTSLGYRSRMLVEFDTLSYIPSQWSCLLISFTRRISHLSLTLQLNKAALHIIKKSQNPRMILNNSHIRGVPLGMLHILSPDLLMLRKHAMDSPIALSLNAAIGPHQGPILQSSHRLFNSR